MKNKTTIFLIAAVFLVIGVVPAFAADSDTLIAGIPKNATAAEFITYFFNLAVAVGAFIAVVIVIMAGIEWMNSDGNPSKIEGAKDKIKNTLLGVAILIGCYLILDAINPDLKTIKINNLSCSDGIVVTTVATEDVKSKQICIRENISKIDYSIESTLDWNFPEDTILAVYTYSGENYSGVRTEYSCENGGCSGKFGEISGAKSIYFLKKQEGFYLFDQTDYKLGVKAYPYHLSTSVSDLGEFNNFTSSIKRVDPDPEVDNSAYLGIAFSDPNYRGACSFIGKSVSNMNGPVETDKYTFPIQNNQMSSMIVRKASLDSNIISPEKGGIILYSTADCGESASASAEIKMCAIRSLGIHRDITSYCGWNSGDEVMSIWISGPIGIALSTTPTGSGVFGKCRYFDLSTISGTCEDIRKYSDIFNPSGGVKPVSFITIEADNK